MAAAYMSPTFAVFKLNAATASLAHTLGKIEANPERAERYREYGREHLAEVRAAIAYLEAQFAEPAVEEAA